MYDPTGSSAKSDGVESETGTLIEGLILALEAGTIDKDEVLKALNVKRQKGRKAPPLPEFTFEGSGITVNIRRMGPFTLDQIRLSLQREEGGKGPRPPMVEVNYGTKDQPDMRSEENPADPAYKEALAVFQKETTEKEGRKFIDTIVNHAVVCELGEEELEEIAHARAFLIGLGADADEVKAISDHEIYVKHVCVKSTGDLKLLQEAVIGESIPTEERIQAQEATFRGNVQEETPEILGRAPVGDELQQHTGLGVGSAVVGYIQEGGVRGPTS
jgi:hypothetical protein